MNRMNRMLSITVRFILENVFVIIILTHFHKSYHANGRGSIKIDSYWSGWICQCSQHTSDCDDGQCCLLGDVNKWNSTIACCVLMSEIQQRIAIDDLVVKWCNLLFDEISHEVYNKQLERVMFSVILWWTWLNRDRNV